MQSELDAEYEYITKLELREEELEAAERAKNSFLSFMGYTKKNYKAKWFHRVLCAYIDFFVEGKIKNLMVFMPPRHGKSEHISRKLPAYILGKYPNKSVITAAYSAKLASLMSGDTQSTMDSEEYRSIFPDSVLLQTGMSFIGKTPVRTSDYFEIANPNFSGSNKNVGVGGSLTGFGFDFGLIDDPFKNREEADSETTRESVWNWYTSTFLTRQESDQARKCILMTRWHEDDLAGRLLEIAKKDPEADQWTVLTFPALATFPPANINDHRAPGEALWPEKFSAKFLQKQKSANSRDFSALYQQNPFTEGGAILKKSYWQYYAPHELPKFLDELILSADCAFKDLKTSDNVAIQVWGRKGANKYLIDEYCEKMDFIKTCNAILSMVRKYPQIGAKLVEDKANGSAVISAMKRRVSGLIPVEPVGSKVARAYAVSPQCESGNVFLPVPETCTKFNVEEFIDECAKFPNGKHDDRVDACTQALRRLETSEGLELGALTIW